MAEQQRPEQEQPEQCHPEQDLLVEVALGHAQVEQQEEVTGHLPVCATCRRDYGEIADSIELVLPAVPRVATPSGFDADVLARLAAERDGQAPPPAGEGGRRESRHRPARWAVAAGLVGLAIGAGAAIGLQDGDEPVPVAASQWETPLMDSGGQVVGTVARSWSADGPALVVQIDDGPVGYHYTCRLVLADGTVEEVGRWRLAEDRPNSWVVPAPDVEVEVVDMVSDDGEVWFSAEF